MSFAFENLDVYQRSLSFVERTELLTVAEAEIFKEHLTIIGKMLTNLVKTHE